MRAKTRPDLTGVELCKHSDGRVWVRYNGRIVYEGRSVHLPVIAKAIYRKCSTTIELAGAALLRASGSIVEFTHPNFVRPYGVV